MNSTCRASWLSERVLSRASDLWVQASLDYKQRLQQLLFRAGIADDGIRFNRTAVTAPSFNYLAPDQSAEEILVSREGIGLAGGSRRLTPRDRMTSWSSQTERSEGSGEPRRNRTFNPQIKSLLLCQLS
jgi:hypothetical protein